MTDTLTTGSENEVKIFWDMDNNDLETRKRVKEYFEKFHTISKVFEDCPLHCEEYNNGLHIVGTIKDENTIHNCMWSIMMRLAPCRWFRSVVKKCVWTDGYGYDELISGSAELIKEGLMELHD